jgi:transposase
MATTQLTDEQWSKMVKVLRVHPHAYVGSEDECRLFVEAVLWLDRTGAQWRMLPERYGKWNSIYRRFARWCDAGVWEALLEHFAGDADMEYLIIDSTIIRAHPCAAGAQKNRRTG